MFVATGFNQQSIVKDGLVLWLDANDKTSYSGTGTTWKDLSRTAGSGSLVNGPTYNSANGGSIVFDGVDDYVNLTTSTIFTNSSYTIETWQKMTSFDLSNFRTSVSVLGQGPNFTGKIISIRWYQDPDTLASYIAVENRNQSFITTTDNSFNLNTWYQVIFTYNYSNNIGIVYINGVQNISDVFTPFVGTNSTIQLGALSSNFNWYGNIAVNRFYNRALSAQEVLQNYNANKNRFGL